MNKVVVSAAIGVAIGGIVGYFVGGMTCAKHYKRTIEELQDENDELIDEMKKTREKAVSEPQKGITEAVSNVRSEKDQKQYHNLASKYGNPEKDESRTEKDIRIISEQEFKENIEYMDNEQVTWYKEDGVLIDSADMPIHNEEETIGIEALDKLENYPLDVLYVSNDIEDKLYEIIVENDMSYYRDLMGME